MRVIKCDKCNNIIKDHIEIKYHKGNSTRKIDLCKNCIDSISQFIDDQDPDEPTKQINKCSALCEFLITDCEHNLKCSITGKKVNLGDKCTV